MHSIRMGDNATQSMIDHCPVLAEGRLPVNCSQVRFQETRISSHQTCLDTSWPDCGTQKTMRFCNPILARNVSHPVPLHNVTNLEAACALCSAAGMREDTRPANAPRHWPLTIGPDRDQQRLSTSWLVKAREDLLPLFSFPGLPSALRAFYPQWVKMKACLQRVRKIEVEHGARFKFVVKTRADWPFEHGPALSSLLNPTITYSRCLFPAHQTSYTNPTCA